MMKKLCFSDNQVQIGGNDIYAYKCEMVSDIYYEEVKYVLVR